jgi:hypothetical protein
MLADLPVIAASPTQTNIAAASRPPDAPARLAMVDCVCPAMNYFVALGGSDKIESAQGCRIYRDRQSIAMLGKNAKGLGQAAGSGS